MSVHCFVRVHDDPGILMVTWLLACVNQHAQQVLCCMHAGMLCFISHVTQKGFCV